MHIKSTVSTPDGIIQTITLETEKNSNQWLHESLIKMREEALTLVIDLAKQEPKPINNKKKKNDEDDEEEAD